MLRRYEDGRDYNKRPCYNLQELERQMQHATDGRVQRLKSLCLSAPEPDIYIEPLGYDQPLGVTKSQRSTSLDAPDPPARSLMAMAQEFLSSESKYKVLLLMGDPGSGKTVFVKHLERELWREYTGPNAPIPILINLQEFSNSGSDLLGQVLKSKCFHPEHIQHLRRSKRQFILICDGYDEAQVQGNIYNQNRFNRDGQWMVKLIIACRSDKIGRDSDGRFQPEVDDRYSFKKLDQFQKAATASFTLRQIEDYVKIYVAKQLQVAVRQSSAGTQEIVQRPSSKVLPSTEGNRHSVWTEAEYMNTLREIPNLMELVKNPYILSFILDHLPTIAGSTQDVARSRVSFDVLYKYIFDHWMGVGKQRLHGKTMSSSEQQALGRLTEYGFRPTCMDYLKDLAVEIFTKQGGDPVVEYSHLRRRTTDSWKTRFFGPDPDTKLLQESVPLIRSGNYYRFVHPSLLQYLYSLAIFDPNSSDDEDHEPDDFGTGGQSSGEFDSDDSRGGGLGMPSRSNTSAALERGPTPSQGKASQPAQAAEKVQASEKGRALEEGHKLGVTNIAKRSMAVQFLADRVQKSQYFKEQLVETVRESRYNRTTDHTLAANAMTILVRSGMRFNSADLQGIKIKGANLTGGEFDSTDLRNSDLRDVTFDKCWLRQVDFMGAQLEGAQFGEKPLDLPDVPTTSAYSFDGTLYAVGFTNGSITIFDAVDWVPIHTHQESKKSITALAFSPKGDLLSFGNRIGLLKSWNFAKKTFSAPFGEHDDSVNNLVYCPHGNRIATAGQDGKVGIWDAASGERIIFRDAHHGGVSSVAFSPDGEQLVSGGFDKILRLWNLETGASVSTLEGHEGAISQVVFSPTGLNIASSSSDKTLRTWSASKRSWSVEATLREHSERVTSIAYSPDGEQLVSCSEDNTIRTWDSRSGSSGPIFQGHTDQVLSIAFSPDGKQLVSCGRDKALRVWDCRAAVKGAVIFGRTNTISSGMYPYSTFNRDATDNDKTLSLTRPDPRTCFFCSAPFGTDTTSFVISPNGFLVASACTIDNSPTVVVWYRETNERRHDLHGHEKKISSIVFSPDSLRIVSGDFKGVLRVCDAESGTLIWTQKEHKRKVTSIAYSSNGHWIASGSEDDTVRLWNAISGDMMHAFDAEDSGIQCVAFSPSGSWIASCGEDGTVRLWDPNNLVPGAVLYGDHNDSINSVAFSPDDVHIASGGNDRIVRIWNINTGAVVHVLEGHINPVRCLAYSPSGKYIASASDDRTLKIWNVGSGELESTLDHDEGVSLVSYSSDGAFILTGTKDYKAHGWIYAHDCQDTAITSTTAVSKGGKHVASSLGGKTVQLWNTESGELGPNLYGHTGSVDSVSFSPFGDFIATASSDGTVRIWDTAKGDSLEELGPLTGIVTCVVFSPNGKQIATSAFDQTLRWWDLSIPDSDLSSKESGGTLLQESEERSLVTLQAPPTDEQTYKLGAPLDGTSGVLDGIFVHEDSGLFYAPVYSPDGKEISVISGQHGVLRFDTQSKIAHRALVGHSKTVTCIAYSPPGDRIATSSDDGTARIWDPQTGNELLRLEGHRGCVTSVVFSPFRHQLATSSADGTVRVWDVSVNATHRQIADQELTGHIGPVLCVAYSPDGKFLASGGEDRTMRLWNPFSGACLAEVRDFAVGVKTIQWSKSARGGLLLVTGCKENPLRVWELVQLVHAKGQRDGEYQIRRYWGVGTETLAVSGTRLGQEHGLSKAECKLLEQRGAAVASGA